MLSVTIHCLVTRDQNHYHLNVFGLLDGAGIAWNSLDSRNIEIFSSLLLLLPELISNLQVTSAKYRRTSSSCIRRWCHCGGSIRRFLEGLIDHVITIGWWLLTLHSTCDRCVSISIHFPFKNRNRNRSQSCCGLLSWSCFSNWFSRSYVLFFRGQHRFWHVLINAIHDSDPRNGVVLKQRWYLNFDAVSIIMIANFYVQDWADPHSWESILWNKSPFHCEASYILGINVASVVLPLYQKKRSILLVRQASNPHQNAVWINSGLLTNVRFFFCSYSCTSFHRCCALVEFSAKERSVGISILSKCSGAAGFTGALRSLGTSLHESAIAPKILSWFAEITVRRSNSMFSWQPLKCILLLCFVILLSQRHWRHKILDDWILRNLPSYFQQIDSMISHVCQCKFRTTSLLIQAPRKTNDREGICELNLQLSVTWIHTFLCFLLLSILCRCTLTWRWSCLWSPQVYADCKSLIRLWIFSRRPTVVIPWNFFPLELRRHCRRFGSSPWSHCFPNTIHLCSSRSQRWSVFHFHGITVL